MRRVVAATSSFALQEGRYCCSFTHKPVGKMKTIIHVNQHTIRANVKHGKKDPVITVKTYKSNKYAHEALILDPSGANVIATVRYSPEKPLSCGARVWIETQCPVDIIVHTPETEEGGEE
jgi:hypothetical protein